MHFWLKLGPCCFFRNLWLICMWVLPTTMTMYTTWAPLSPSKGLETSSVAGPIPSYNQGQSLTSPMTGQVWHVEVPQVSTQFYCCRWPGATSFVFFIFTVLMFPCFELQVSERCGMPWVQTASPPSTTWSQEKYPPSNKDTRAPSPSLERVFSRIAAQPHGMFLSPSFIVCISSHFLHPGCYGVCLHNSRHVVWSVIQLLSGGHCPLGCSSRGNLSFTTKISSYCISLPLTGPYWKGTSENHDVPSG